jgi:hypothetical protein
VAGTLPAHVGFASGEFDLGHSTLSADHQSVYKS